MQTLPEEANFANILLDVGNGVLNDEDNNFIIPHRCLAIADSDIVNDIYGKIREKRYEELANSAILSARNLDVEEIINGLWYYSTKHLKEYIQVLIVLKIVIIDINQGFLPVYLNTLNTANLLPHELRLRTNCIVILIRNLCINEVLCYGTRLLILELGNHLLRCTILNSDKSGEIVFMNRITLYWENVYPFIFKRRRFPTKLAFAMTINKSQGQTFENIGIDLRKNVFNHGRLYVALSREVGSILLRESTNE